MRDQSTSTATGGCAVTHRRCHSSDPEWSSPSVPAGSPGTASPGTSRSHTPRVTPHQDTEAAACPSLPEPHAPLCPCAADSAKKSSPRAILHFLAVLSTSSQCSHIKRPKGAFRVVFDEAIPSTTRDPGCRGLARVGAGQGSPRHPHIPAAPGASGGLFPTAHTSLTKNATKIIRHSTVKSLSCTT